MMDGIICLVLDRNDIAEQYVAGKQGFWETHTEYIMRACLVFEDGSNPRTRFVATYEHNKGEYVR